MGQNGKGPGSTLEVYKAREASWYREHEMIEVSEETLEIQQYRTEQYGTEWNRTEQDRTGQDRTEQYEIEWDRMERDQEAHSRHT